MYQLGETSWVDSVISVGQKVADMNAARRQQANAAAAQRAAASTTAPNVDTPEPKSNTLMYVGLGAGVLAVAGIAYKMTQAPKAPQRSARR